MRRVPTDAKGSPRLRDGELGASSAQSSAPFLRAVPRERRSPEIVVQKFGGTSVGSIERIRNVARRVIATQDAGHDVVVVVSAMAGETNRLLDLAKETNPVSDRAELDAIAAAGEQVSAGLLALAIQAEGRPARSLLGHQVRVLTDAAHGDGKVQRVEISAIKECLAAGVIPVIAGFQGVGPDGRIVTLGRGGSDTSAVVVAAALSAICEIYTDVDGVYAADPSVVPGARKLTRCGLDEMLLLAGHGAKVLHPRSVLVARTHGVTMYVRSSFSEDSGTVLVRAPESSTRPLEGPTFVGLAQDRSIARLVVSARSDAEAIRLLARLTALRIPVDMAGRDAAPGVIAFAVPGAEVDRALDAIHEAGAVARADTAVAKVTLVGRGLADPAIVTRFLDAALATGAYPHALIADESTIRCLVDEAFAKPLLAAVYAEFLATEDDALSPQLRVAARIA